MFDSQANSSSLSRIRALPWVASMALLSACGSGSGAVETVIEEAEVGDSVLKPDGSGFYIADQHFGGDGDAVFLEELYWGRLVDIWAEDPQTGIAEQVYTDFVIGDNVLTQFGKWRLEESPLTGRTRLIVLRANTDAPNDAFDELVAEAENSAGPVLEKGTGIGETPPFSFIARNASLVLRFSDLVDPSTVSLNDSLQVLVGNPPEQAYEARLLFSPSHGGLAAGTGEFFSTRLIIDFTIDSTDLALLDNPLELNGLGLPAAIDPLQANLAIAIPTEVDPGGANFDLVRNLRGRALSFVDNGPTDSSLPTLPVVRAMRSGSEDDPENGFLADNLPPSLIGSQAVSVTNAVVDPAGEPGIDFVVNFAYATPECSISPIVGDVLQIGSTSFNVTQQAAASQGIVSGLRISLPVGLDPILNPAALLSQALFRTPWRNSLPSTLAACFVRFSPEPASPPAAGIQPGTQILVEFSEPMDPASVRPFDTFVASSTAEIGSVDEFVVSTVEPSSDFRTFRLSPVVGFDHTFEPSGSAPETFFVELSSDIDDLVGLTDLAGNFLTDSLPQFQFAIDATAPSNQVGGWALPFNGTDEFIPSAAGNGNDLAGQIFYDLDRGEIFPRNVSRFSAVADRNSQLIGPMQPVETGLQTPLSNLGSKMHIMWRYSDMGYTVSYNDGSFMNLDVEGVSLSPLGGSVTQTFYPLFEMRLGHSDRLHDEWLDKMFISPMFEQSGFLNNTSFAENYLSDPDNPPVLVHDREEGFFVAQTGVFQSETGTVMLRYPMNVNAAPGEERTYTWRDTAITTRGGLNNQGTETVIPGIPHPQEHFLVFGNAGADPLIGGDFEYLYEGGPGGIPSIGLPLLMEFSCFPSEAVSLNNFAASISTTAAPRPFSRAFSTGGFNVSGNPVIKNPDTETAPTGGFNGNPALGPLGSTTNGRDPTVYIGQLDIVVRISRVYTTMISANGPTPDYVALVQEPNPSDQPSGTRIEFAFRGDDDTPAADYFDSADLDLYGNSIGETSTGTTELSLSQPEWSDSLDSIDSLQWAQVRMSFIGNTETMLTPRLSALGVAYRN